MVFRQRIFTVGCVFSNMDVAANACIASDANAFLDGCVRQGK
jgi:hypothetical protein